MHILISDIGICPIQLNARGSTAGSGTSGAAPGRASSPISLRQQIAYTEPLRYFGGRLKLYFLTSRITRSGYRSVVLASATCPGDCFERQRNAGCTCREGFSESVFS